MARQYVAIVFKPGQRSYTYHWDGPLFAKGDRVKVAARRGDGWDRVTVVGVTEHKPSFETKAILGPVEEAVVEEPIAAPIGDLFAAI